MASGGTKGALVGQLNDPIQTAASNTELFSIRPDEPFVGESKLETGEAGGDSIALPDPLFPPERLDFTSRKLDSFSFTGLAHAAESRETTRSYGERFGRRDEETETVEETEVVLRDPILPKGERTGSMIHEVFEKVNYGEVLEAASPDELLRANGPALALVKEHL
ncbi:MAG: hypothetical protein KC917_23955, partial [Candidatus Omnitrophica bacterium]|nr:hypothetical protein [Candidatus Omnitrophota bacterium]